MEYVRLANKIMSTSYSGIPGKKTAQNLSYLFSSLCLIHCLMMPVIIILIPAFSTFFNDTLELILILSVIPVSLYAFYPTWIKHKNIKLLIFFLLGLTIILTSQFAIEHVHISNFSELYNNSVNGTTFIFRTILLIIGVVILALTVYKNNKHTHVCHNPNHVH
ncbi:MAG TPA: hypothetical protein DCE78_07605 [Bacteroidetes bacterium]|nr:hypothetical protein [Bacteroidota bacterium]